MTMISEKKDDYFYQLASLRNLLTVKSLIGEANVNIPEGDSLSHGWNLVIGQNDKGVELNRGRVGSKDAGRVLLHHLSLMIKPIDTKVSLYPHLINPSFKELSPLLWRENILHLGSGHDHAYQFLELALNNGIKNFIIINLDAHADMRKDSLLHSGTPFRFFYEQHKSKIQRYSLYQFGLNPYSQNREDLVLEGAEVKVLWQQELTISKVKECLSTIQKEINHQDTLFFVSVDADILAGNVMSAVSAVNPRGLAPELLIEILVYLKKEFKIFQPKLGLYEYNPLYDDISGKAAKLLATMLYDWIFSCHSNNS